MSKSGQWFIAVTQGPQFTLYSTMKKMGLPLTERQEELQKQFEEKYTRKEVKN